jgi:hypothetical protein
MNNQCEWCNKQFSPRNSGGTPQKFCSKGCKRSFEKNIREWSYKQYQEGKLNLSELQSMHSLEQQKKGSR